ncbi:hypothetical protein BCR33DRAFT_781096 [Rhizoclosmatium globosum]|uniref:Uncharacterized protein n=1 Tax=Rhizoclosmatium globosum TaxID=329046 RepID=A0A1Y2CTR1_9FUNG|nr:hypothetical protein BCR33DRAFT_781096 [Rhizoclosmatium globosum]|eukprot:ORY50347.1 hypothetical protein BCR33DRAFT_781096 [Rhizoclosmatium globosum]
MKRPRLLIALILPVLGLLYLLTSTLIYASDEGTVITKPEKEAARRNGVPDLDSGGQRPKTLLPPKESAKDMLEALHPSDPTLKCIHLPATSNFTIQLCRSTEHCGTGLFAIERKDKAKILEKYYRDSIGPDAFQLLFDGPQRETPAVWTHKGDCLYTLPFRLINPGKYTVNLVHTFDSFEALVEVGDPDLRVVYDKILVDYKMDVCDASCQSFTAKRIESMRPTLPLCSRTEPQQGVYLRMNFETDRETRKFDFHKYFYIAEPLGCKYDQRFELEDFATLGKCHNKNNSILLHGDSHLRVSTQTIDARLAGHAGTKYNPKFELIHAKYYPPDTTITTAELTLRHHNNNVLFGDNEKIPPHSQSLPNPPRHATLRPRIPRTQNRLPTPRPIQPLAHQRKRRILRPRQTPIPNNTEISFEFKRFLEQLVEGHPHRGWDDNLNVNQIEATLYPYDAYVFNFAAWALQSERLGGHYTVQRFQNALDFGTDLLTRVNSLRQVHFGKKEVDVVWMGITAFPVQEDRRYRKEGDWRTNYRMRVLSEYAEKVARRRGFKILNTFEGSLPWTEFTKDGSHFDSTPAMDAWVDEVFHKLNLCGYSP